VFKISDKYFMETNMKIDITSIENKLNDSSISEFSQIIINAVESFIGTIQSFEALKEDTFTFEDNVAEKFINSHSSMLSEKIQNDEALQVLDALRYAFVGYAFNGLHQLYTRQENQCWGPKIILTEVLTPNDISSLDQDVKLYRGCDIVEHKRGRYGQAWTTSLQVAKDFAYTHYQGQEWFDTESRVVLETIYSRDNILFSDQSVEFEVVVDVSKLGKVNKHS